MQLFISDQFQINKNKITIKEERIIHQLKKVLRANIDYNFLIQNKTWNIIRYQIQIIEIKNEIIWKIINIKEKESSKNEKKWIIQSILNKFSKMELIVQKLTEIWIWKIYFTATQRSIFKNINEKKLERFNKIALEACEQSYWWKLPEIKVIKNINEIPWTKAIINFNWKKINEIQKEKINYIIIWPEGWFTKKDIENINPQETINLWEKTLRAETASIITWYLFSQ